MNPNGVGARKILANPKVSDVENEGADEGRCFVHLKAGWRFSDDGSDEDPQHVRSFSRVREAQIAVNKAVAYETGR